VIHSFGSPLIWVGALLTLALALPGPCAAESAGEKVGVAVADVRIPEGLMKDLDPGTVKDLLLACGRRSDRYELRLPNTYLAEILKEHRLRVQLDRRLPEELKIEYGRLDAQMLLLPTLSRPDGYYIFTATLVNLKSNKPLDQFVVEGKKEDKLSDLAGKLWEKVDPPKNSSASPAGPPRDRITLGLYVGGQLGKEESDLLRKLVAASEKANVSIYASEGPLRESHKAIGTIVPGLTDDRKFLSKDFRVIGGLKQVDACVFLGRPKDAGSVDDLKNCAASGKDILIVPGAEKSTDAWKAIVESKEVQETLRKYKLVASWGAKEEDFRSFFEAVRGRRLGTIIKKEKE
jgi:hypothetical protein